MPEIVPLFVRPPAPVRVTALRIVPTLVSDPASVKVTPTAIVLVPARVQSAPPSTVMVPKLVKLCTPAKLPAPVPPNSSVLVPVPPWTAPVKLAPGNSSSRLAPLANRTAVPFWPMIIPLLITVVAKVPLGARLMPKPALKIVPALVIVAVPPSLKIPPSTPSTEPDVVLVTMPPLFR